MPAHAQAPWMLCCLEVAAISTVYAAGTSRDAVDAPRSRFAFRHSVVDVLVMALVGGGGTCVCVCGGGGMTLHVVTRRVVCGVGDGALRGECTGRGAGGCWDFLGLGGWGGEVVPWWMQHKWCLVFLPRGHVRPSVCLQWVLECQPCCPGAALTHAHACTL